MGPCCNVLRWCHMCSPGGSSAGGLSSTPPVNKTVGLPGLHTSLKQHHGITIRIACHFMSDLPFTLHTTSCLIKHSHYMSLLVWFTIHITCHFMFAIPFTVYATSCLINQLHYMLLHVRFTIHITCHFISTIHSTCHFMSTIHITCHFTSESPFTLHATSYVFSTEGTLISTSGYHTANHSEQNKKILYSNFTWKKFQQIPHCVW